MSLPKLLLNGDEFQKVAELVEDDNAYRWHDASEPTPNINEMLLCKLMCEGIGEVYDTIHAKQIKHLTGEKLKLLAWKLIKPYNK